MAVRKRVWRSRAVSGKLGSLIMLIRPVIGTLKHSGARRMPTLITRRSTSTCAPASTLRRQNRLRSRRRPQNWIESVALDEREESTLAQYRQHAAHINKRIGNLKLAELTAPGITKLRDDLLKTMSRAMARKVLSSLKSLLRHAQSNGDVAQNVALAVKIKKNKRDKKKLEIGVDIPTSEEIKTIIAAAEGRTRPFLLTAIFAGLRSSELRGLRWSDVDLKQAKLDVRQRADRYGKIGSPKSESSHRTVPLAPQVVQALREWKLQCPKGTGLVFPAVSGDAVALHNNTVRLFTAAVRAASLVDELLLPK